MSERHYWIREERPLKWGCYLLSNSNREDMESLHAHGYRQVDRAEYMRFRRAAYQWLWRHERSTWPLSPRHLEQVEREATDIDQVRSELGVLERAERQRAYPSEGVLRIYQAFMRKLDKRANALDAMVGER